MISYRVTTTEQSPQILKPVVVVNVSKSNNIINIAITTLGLIFKNAWVQKQSKTQALNVIIHIIKLHTLIFWVCKGFISNCY